MSADTFYTDKILDENFRMVKEGFDWTAQGFRAIDKHFAHLEGHILELTKKQAELMAKVPKKRSKLKFVVLVGVAFYVGTKIGDKIAEYDWELDGPGTLHVKMKQNPKQSAETTVRSDNGSGTNDNLSVPRDSDHFDK
jgi:hypothetical protein